MVCIGARRTGRTANVFSKVGLERLFLFILFDQRFVALRVMGGLHRNIKSHGESFPSPKAGRSSRCLIRAEILVEFDFKKPRGQRSHSRIGSWPSPISG